MLEFRRDERYRSMVEEMLQFRTAAESTLRCYVEMPDSYLVDSMGRSVNAFHREYLICFVDGNRFRRLWRGNPGIEAVQAARTHRDFGR